MYCSEYFEGETKGEHSMELSKECAAHQSSRRNPQYTKMSRNVYKETTASS